MIVTGNGLHRKRTVRSRSFTGLYPSAALLILGLRMKATPTIPPFSDSVVVKCCEMALTRPFYFCYSNDVTIHSHHLFNEKVKFSMCAHSMCQNLNDFC